MTLTRNQRKVIRLVLLYACTAIVLFWALAPIYWVLVSSISTRAELFAAPEKVWFPAQPTFQNFVDIFTTGPKYRDGGFLPTADLMWSGMRNSVIFSTVSAAIVTLLTTGAGFIFARFQFRGKQVTFFYLMLMMPLPIWVSLIALFFLMSQLELLDTLAGLILIMVTILIPLGTWLMTTYIRDVPTEVLDAARVDGCSPWQMLSRLIVPLVRPGMVAVFLVVFLTTWNNFLIPLIFTRTMASQPMTVVLTLFVGQYEVAWEAMSAAATVMMLPPLLMALFFQRYLVRGLTMGAVK